VFGSISDRPIGVFNMILFADQSDASTAIIVALIAAVGGAVAAGVPAWITYIAERKKLAKELTSTIQREGLESHSGSTVASVDGMYKVTGFHSPTSATYGGEAEISHAGSLLTIRWKSGQNVWQGVGLLHDGVLSVAIEGSKGRPTVAQYAIDTTASPLTLRGKWAYPSDTSVSSETLTRTL
jgi:hypothetical protein